MTSTSIISNYGHRTVGDHLLDLVTKDSVVRIASAYFNNIDILKRIHKKAKRIELVILLDHGTSSDALRKAFDLSKVEIRYFNSQFHSKFYVIDECAAIVGSANFTHAGLDANEEVGILLSKDSEGEDKSREISDLIGIFSRYWHEANPLTTEIMDAFEDYSQETKSSPNENQGARNTFLEKAGVVSPKKDSSAISAKINNKKRSASISSTMSPDKLDLVFFIMDNVESFLRERNGICEKDKFRQYIFRSYTKTLYQGYEDNNAFGWAFNYLFHLNITERATDDDFYKLRDYSGS